MLASLILFSLTEAFFSASPGPAVVMVVSAAMVAGRGAAHRAALGVLSGNLIYFIISCAIFIGVTEFDARLFWPIKIVGALFLAYWLAMRYCRPAAAIAPAARRRHFFAGALAMQLANPKTILFFSAFLPQFVHADHNIPAQFALMAFLSWMIEYAILMLYIRGAEILMRRMTRIADRLEHLGNATMVIAVIWSIALGW